MSDPKPRQLMPAAVRRKDLNEALAPFYDLLNITAYHSYGVPGIQIMNDSVVMVVPAPEKRADWDSDRPPGRRGLPVVADDERAAELAQVVTIEVTD